MVVLRNEPLLSQAANQMVVGHRCTTGIKHLTTTAQHTALQYHLSSYQLSVAELFQLPSL